MTLPELVPGHAVPLTSHPAHPPSGITAVSVRLLAYAPGWLSLRWRIEDAERLVVPPFAGKARADGLWRTTCFELFVRDQHGGYCEFNFSPTEQWAAYDFAGYRDGMTGRTMPREPVCDLRGSGNTRLFEAALPRGALPPLPAAIGISAVIEEAGGVKSYWALAHPDGPADFHDPACFALMLAAPDQA